MFGIDVSHFQGNIIWHEVLDNKPKIDFCFLKATQGTTYTDNTLKYNSFEAKKAGVPIGYYHFATLNTANVTEDARAEAQYFVSVVKKCADPDLPLVLDIEENKASLPPAQVLLWINTFFSELQLLGYHNYILYSYTPFLNSNLPDNHNLGGVKLWIAAYTNGDSPKLPKGWNSFYIWQYSAKGKISGIKSDVDLNKTLSTII